jgi:hypothetical protein
MLYIEIPLIFLGVMLNYFRYEKILYVNEYLITMMRVLYIKNTW